MGTIRPAERRDAAACAALYNYYIVNTTVTMELEAVTEEAFARRIESVTAEFPWLVWEEDGEILGYGYLSRFHERAAYRFTCDLSLYVDRGARGRGIGAALLEALEKKAQELGFCHMISLITTENAPSAAFHEKHGFKKAGEIPDIAFKHRRWMGLMYYKKTLLDRPDPEIYE